MYEIVNTDFFAKFMYGLNMVGNVLTIASLLAVVTLPFNGLPRYWRVKVVPGSVGLTEWWPHILFRCNRALTKWETLDLGSRASRCRCTPMPLPRWTTTGRLTKSYGSRPPEAGFEPLPDDFDLTPCGFPDLREPEPPIEPGD